MKHHYGPRWSDERKLTIHIDEKCEDLHRNGWVKQIGCYENCGCICHHVFWPFVSMLEELGLKSATELKQGPLQG